jgi:hypothetical protein
VRLKREERRSGELELSTGCHARARSCDADVTTGKKRLEAACFDLALYSSSSPSPSPPDLLMNMAETQ